MVCHLISHRSAPKKALTSPFCNEYILRRKLLESKLVGAWFPSANVRAVRSRLLQIYLLGQVHVSCASVGISHISKILKSRVLLDVGRSKHCYHFEPLITPDTSIIAACTDYVLTTDCTHGFSRMSHETFGICNHLQKWNGWR